jgi:hypothetical protein
MLDVLRLELKQAGTPVSVTTILPASIDTPFFDHARTKLGVKPQGVPPVYDPILVARAIVRVAERPRRQVVVGGAGQVMVKLHRHFPRLTEALLARIAFRGQRTSEQKALGAPDNLRGPLQDDRVHGSDSAQARRGRRAMRIGGATMSALALTVLAGALVRRLSAA